MPYSFEEIEWPGIEGAPWYGQSPEDDQYPGFGFYNSGMPASYWATMPAGRYSPLPAQYGGQCQTYYTKWGNPYTDCGPGSEGFQANILGVTDWQAYWGGDSSLYHRDRFRNYSDFQGSRGGGTFDPTDILAPFLSVPLGSGLNFGAWLSDYGMYLDPYNPMKEEMVNKGMKAAKDNLQEKELATLAEAESGIGATGMSAGYAGLLPEEIYGKIGLESQLIDIAGQREIDSIHEDYMSSIYSQIGRLAEVGAFDNLEDYVPEGSFQHMLDSNNCFNMLDDGTVIGGGPESTDTEAEGGAMHGFQGDYTCISGVPGNTACGGSISTPGSHRAMALLFNGGSLLSSLPNDTQCASLYQDYGMNGVRNCMEHRDGMQLKLDKAENYIDRMGIIADDLGDSCSLDELYDEEFGAGWGRETRLPGGAGAFGQGTGGSGAGGF